MHASHRKHVEHCLNCGAPTPGEFCSICGQEAVDAAVTFRDQLSDFFSEVFTFESRLPQTVRLLLTKPGALTRAYNAGQRVRYVTPLKLYLFASVAFFVVLSLAAGRGASHVAIGTADGAGFRLGGPRTEVSAEETKDAGAAPGTHTIDDWKTAEDFDAWQNKQGNGEKLPAFLVPHIRSLLKSPDGYMSTLVDMLSRVSMALVPLHALLLKLMYWRSRRLYGEHIVFSLHVHAYSYILSAASYLLGVVANRAVSEIADSVAVLACAAYVVLAARTAYSEGLVRSAFKMAAVGIGYCVALFGGLALTAALVFFMS